MKRSDPVLDTNQLERLGLVSTGEWWFQGLS